MDVKAETRTIDERLNVAIRKIVPAFQASITVERASDSLAVRPAPGTCRDRFSSFALSLAGELDADGSFFSCGQDEEGRISELIVIR